MALCTKTWNLCNSVSARELMWKQWCMCFLYSVWPLTTCRENLEKPRNVREFDSCHGNIKNWQKIMELSGESFQGKLFITNFVLGSMPVFTVVASWLCIFYAVNYYMGKRNLGRSAAKGWENIREFDTACSVYTCCSCKYLLLFVSVFFLCIFVSLHFYRTAFNAAAVLWWDFCPSVRPSVC